MIVADSTVFPGAFVVTLVPFLQLIDSDVPVHKRPLRATDEIQAIGVFPLNLIPDQDSLEMRGMASPGYNTPTLTEYRVNIQGLVKHGDESEGIAIHSVMAKRILTTVARNDALRIALGALTHTEEGLVERAIRWKVLAQRYLTQEINGLFQYASITELEFTTQTT